MSEPVIEKKKIRGTVQRIITPHLSDPDNYYGFIIGTDGQNYFLHCREVIGDAYAQAGDTAYFYPSPEDGKRNLRAMRIEIISSEVNEYLSDCLTTLRNLEERLSALVGNA